jgi:hypothetical protein
MSGPNNGLRALVDQYPLLPYACLNVLYHANLAARTVNQVQFLNSFPTAQWLRLMAKFDQPEGQYPPTTGVMHIVACFGYSDLFRIGR